MEWSCSTHPDFLRVDQPIPCIEERHLRLWSECRSLEADHQTMGAFSAHKMRYDTF